MKRDKGDLHEFGEDGRELSREDVRVEAEEKAAVRCHE
jgi:hypothetical protein